jgi:hypothetical protein
MRPASLAWPSSRDFVEAVQNPRLAFRNPELQRCQPALDRFGLPLVASGNFAYAFKLREAADQRAVAVRCFRGLVPDRDKRYELIDRHLRAHRESVLASFVFDAEGILVSGRRYPVMVMEWIEGPTLDLYIEQALHSKPVLQSLANEWLRAVRGLREAQLAHGDLQHGNVIVRDGRIRLIDLDAMFVPAMQGWSSNELGHIHFQHPQRDLHYFDLGLDRFSALVIYLSIVALAEAPALWQRYHDENLIFTRQDFKAPGSSKLLAEVKRLGATPRLLAEALEQALRSRPADTPDLLQLVAAPRPGLPAWMTQPADVHIEVKTREAPPGGAPAASTPAPARAAAVPSPWPATNPAGRPLVPHSPRQPVPPPTPAYIPPLDFDWERVHANALSSALAWFLTTVVFALLPIGAMIHVGSSLSGQLALASFAERHFFLVGLLGTAAVCLTGAYAAAYHAETLRIEALRRVLAHYPGAQNAATAFSWLRRRPQPAPAPKVRLIGDKASRVFHLPSCNLLLAVSTRHRVVFASAHIARAHGFGNCPICLP